MSVPTILTNLAKVYAELAHFDDAWRCISEALTEVQATKATLFEAELNRVAGDVVLNHHNLIRRKRGRISSVRSQFRGSSKQNPGSYGQR